MLRVIDGKAVARIVSGFVAVVLLCLYAYAIAKLRYNAEPSDQIKTILTLVGGLVSALVVAVVGNIRSGGIAATPFTRRSSSLDWVTMAVICSYLLVWLCCGIALLVAWIDASTPSSALDAATKSWLGLAVAAAYAYLGLDPPADPKLKPTPGE